MIKLPAEMQVSAGLALINLSAKYSDSGSTPGLGQPLGNNGGDAGDLSAVPNVYFAPDVAPNWKGGVGGSGPFGVKTENDPARVGGVQGNKMGIKTYKTKPSRSCKPD